MPPGVLKAPSTASGRAPLPRSTVGCGAIPDTEMAWFSTRPKLSVPASNAALLIVTTVLPCPAPLLLKLLEVRKMPAPFMPRVSKSPKNLVVGLTGIEYAFQPAVGSLVFDTAIRKLLEVKGGPSSPEAIQRWSAESYSRRGSAISSCAGLTRVRPEHAERALTQREASLAVDYVEAVDHLHNLGGADGEHGVRWKSITGDLASFHAQAGASAEDSAEPFDEVE